MTPRPPSVQRQGHKPFSAVLLLGPRQHRPGGLCCSDFSGFPADQGERGETFTSVLGPGKHDVRERRAGFHVIASAAATIHVPPIGFIGFHAKVQSRVPAAPPSWVC